MNISPGSIFIRFRKQFYCFWPFVLLIHSCTFPLEVAPEEVDDIIVVEGFISNGPGPHEIRVSRVAKFTSVQNGGFTSLITNARVSVEDQDGNVTAFCQKETTDKFISNGNVLFIGHDSGRSCIPFVSYSSGPTNYLAPEGFSGQVGNTYTLQVKLKDGRTFVSEPQTIAESPDLDSLILKFRRLPSTNDIVKPTAIEVFAQWKDPGEVKNYYSWRLNGIYRIHTPPVEGACCLYDPKDRGDFHCWIREKNIEGNELAFSDRFSDGSKITMPIGMIMDDGIRFANQQVVDGKQYYIEVMQYGISEKAFLFYELLKSQLAVGDGIFAPPPAQVRGNMHDKNNPNAFVIGFFGAFHESRKSTFVHRDMLEEVQLWPNLCDDCRTLAGADEIQNIPDPYK